MATPGEIPTTSTALVTATPTSLLQLAVEKGANIETLTKLLELQEKWEAIEARKAFVTALAAFKANPPKLDKTKRVSYKDVSYSYAPLDQIAATLGTELSKHGISFRWKTEQADGRIIVTCILQHEQGHSESVTLSGGADTTGSKNGIQAIGSTVTYLERYTLLAATGMATMDQDTDGLTMESASDFVANIAGASSQTDLERAYKEAIKGGLAAKDPKALGVFMQARDKRAKELAA